MTYEHSTAILSLLLEADWFSNIGMKDAQNVYVLDTWPEAIANAGSADWENLGLEEANKLHAHVLKASPARVNDWNAIADHVRPLARQLAREKTNDKLIQLKSEAKVVLDCISWDVIHACIEAEFMDLKPPCFFHLTLEWYLRGHFPCGWEGSYPSGRRIIF